MRRIQLVLAALVAVCASIVVAAPAQAAGVDVLTTGSVGGPNVAVGDSIGGTLKPGTKARFITSSGGSSGVSCSMSSFTVKVLTNPAASGTATGSMTAWSFGTCSSNIPNLTVQAITVNNLPYGVSIGINGWTITGGSAGPIQLTFAFTSPLGSITCVYRAVNNVITGTGSNSDSSVSFTNQQLTKASGSTLCPSNLFFSATYIVTDTSVGGAPVFVQ
jgi:hypothetical protein